MKRSPVSLAQIAYLHTLVSAFHLAARGKRGRGDVEAFRDNRDAELRRVHAEVIAGAWRRAYFASIDHAVLRGLLKRKFKDRALLALLARIIGAHEDRPGRGLPIGTLASQHWANFYLSGFDRELLEGGVAGDRRPSPKPTAAGVLIGEPEGFSKARRPIPALDRPSWQ